MTIAEQHNTLVISGEAIPFSLVRGKPRRVRLFFSDENRLCIETASGKLGRFEREFLESKSRWILNGYRERRAVNAKKSRLLARLDSRIQLLGRDTDLEFLPADSTRIDYIPPKRFRIHAPEKYHETHRRTLLYHALLKFAERYLVDRVSFWAAECGLTFNRLRIKELRSKWGSCSSKRNINLNWQLIFLEEALIDYVVIHELMHLREMNHSPQFWAWVARYYPEYKTARKKLKEQAWLIGILT